MRHLPLCVAYDFYGIPVLGFGADYNLLCRRAQRWSEHVAEEHMGKKRRREVHQAVNLKRESKRLLVFVVSTSVVACVAIIALMCFSLSQTGQMKQLVGIVGSLIVLLISIILIVPKSRKCFEVHKTLKAHCKRFNISEEDMLLLRK